jgi:hypothetical protein
MAAPYDSPIHQKDGTTTASRLYEAVADCRLAGTVSHNGMKVMSKR